ncbi:MAG TPA: 5-(carboxyamino)imidazole ribonucleotide mutase [Terriglobales bacterium]|nr:5-(carboxyamino)imidazole ribonucleotide mutase [Terriglobales bacterium]
MTDSSAPGATNARPLVAILMGSDTDLPVMQLAADQLRKFGIPYEMEIVSAHRSPQRTAAFARAAAGRGLRVLIAGAGAAAALAGALAAETTLPVVGVPLATSPLSGFDALLATAMLPAGVPVATVAVGDAGATNAAVLAAQILALADPALAQRLLEYKRELERKVVEKSERLKSR